MENLITSMKILNAVQIREADQFTIDNEPIKSIDLMERASRAFVDWFEQNIPKKGKVFVFCGTGNNGGDGLAIARMLSVKKWNVQAITIKKSAKKTQDFTINYLKLAEVKELKNIEFEDDIQFEITEDDVIIDALFGSGLTRPLADVYAAVVQFINNSHAITISVDAPSGLFIDEPTQGDDVVRADHVVSFQMAKMAFFIQDNEKYIGKFHVVDIGLDRQFIEKTPTKYTYVDQSLAVQIIKKRPKYSHKGDYGKVLIVSGSQGMK